MGYCIRKITLAVIDEGVDAIGLLFRLHDVRGIRVIVLHRPGLTGAGVGKEAALALAENGLYIRQGDGIPRLILGGTVYWARKALVLLVISAA